MPSIITKIRYFCKVRNILYAENNYYIIHRFCRIYQKFEYTTIPLFHKMFCKAMKFGYLRKVCKVNLNIKYSHCIIRRFRVHPKLKYILVYCF